MNRIICLFISMSIILLLILGCSGLPPTPIGTPASGFSSPTAKAPGLGAKQGWEEDWDRTLSAAKGEGKVVVYTSLGSETRSDLTKALKNKYAIEIEFVTGTTADLLAKLVRERQINLYLADAIIAGAGATIPMKSYDMLDKIDSLLMLPEVTDPKVWRVGAVPIIDKDRQILVFINTFIRYIVRNTDMVKDGEISSYADLLKPQYKEKIVLQDPTMPGNAQTFVATLAVLWGMDRAKEYLQSLAKQEPIITRDLRLQVEWIARGKNPLAIAPRIETVADFIKEGAPIAPVKVVEGGHLTGGGGGLAIVKNRPHSQATVIFLNWLLSREGQTIFVKGFGNPSARTDVPTEGFSPMLFPEGGEKIIPQNEEFVLLQGEMGKVARDIFQPLLR